MNLKMLSGQQLSWLIRNSVQTSTTAEGLAVFTRGRFELAENPATSGGGFTLWNTFARVADERELTADGSRWECRERLNDFGTLRAGLRDLVKQG